MSSFRLLRGQIFDNIDFTVKFLIELRLKLQWNYQILFLRWLDWIFLGCILPHFEGLLRRHQQSYREKITTTVLYKDCNLLWSSLTSELPWQRNDVFLLALFAFVFLGTRSFFQKSLNGACTLLSWLDYGKVWTNSMTEFWKYFEKVLRVIKQWINMLST